MTGGTGFRHRVEHVDTDAGGVVHFSRYTSLMETVVLDFLEERGAGLTALGRDGVQLAVTELQMRYLRPAAYRDVLVGEPTVEHVGGAWLRAAATLARREADGRDTALAAGHLVFAAVATDSGRAVPLPAAVRRTLKGITADADLHLHRAARPAGDGPAVTGGAG
ncbi:acyl-CoA thioesterase [Spirillospora sp. NPDC050679]